MNLLRIKIKIKLFIDLSGREDNVGALGNVFELFSSLHTLDLCLLTELKQSRIGEVKEGFAGCGPEMVLVDQCSGWGRGELGLSAGSTFVCPAS